MAGFLQVTFATDRKLKLLYLSVLGACPSMLHVTN